MTCSLHGRGFEAQVDEYVDGTLPGSAAEAFEEHLARCPACRSLAADVRQIRDAARALERHPVPPHVWTRLSARIEGAGRTRPRMFSSSWVGTWQPLAAALVLAASLWWVGDRLSLDGPAPVTSNGAPGDYGDPIAVTYRHAEEQYTTAIAGLERITEAERSTLDPGTADVLQANLTVIDRAIVESRAALENEPQSEVAQESLFEALRHKVALLQDTLALINEMRKGNDEGAARILSGNP